MEIQCNKHLWYTYSLAYLIVGLAGCAKLHEVGGVYLGIAILCVSIWQCFASMVYFKKKIVKYIKHNKLDKTIILFSHSDDYDEIASKTYTITKGKVKLTQAK